jgi:hypothetical protein
MRAALLALAVLVAALHAYSEPGSAPDPVFQVDFRNPNLTPSHWTLSVHPDGSGHFHSERGNATTEAPQTLDAPNVDRDIHLSAEFAQRVFQIARQHHWSGEECESHIKVAFQGWKKFTYSGPEAHGVCEFNYSKDKQMQALGDAFLSVATTILEGARLELLLLHDRLGLDSELDYLSEAAGDGRAQQICAIRGILERLAADESVMERVRKRARELLSKAE